MSRSSFLLLLLFLPTSVGAQSVRIDGETLFIDHEAGEPSVVPLGCRALAHVVRTERAFVACGAGGLVVVDLGSPPRVAERRDLGGAVTGVFVQSGVVWAVTSRTEARPVSGEPIGLAAPTPGTDPTRPGTAAAPRLAPVGAVGEVLERRSGAVVVSLGSRDGLVEGGHVELFVEEEVRLGPGRATKRAHIMAVGEATLVTADRAEVGLGLNEDVPNDARARLTTAEATASLTRPPRAGHVWDLQLTVRPFLAIGALGLGTVNDLSIAYHFEMPMSVQALLEPGGFGFADVGDVVAVAGNAILSYDEHYFELGLGLGVSGLQDDDSDKLESALSLAQVARLGALDGMNLTVHNSFVMSGGEFKYGGTTSAIQTPLTHRLWLLLRGGGGRAGFAFGEVGLRIMIRGNGGSGSVFLSPAVGGGFLFGHKTTDCLQGETKCGREEIDYAGPMVGLGIAWRP